MANQNQLYSEQMTEAAKAFTAFCVPERIIMDGEDITAEVVEKFDGVFAWLRRLAVAFSNFRITAFTITRIEGVVTLCVKSIY